MTDREAKIGSVDKEMSFEAFEDGMVFTSLTTNLAAVRNILSFSAW